MSETPLRQRHPGDTSLDTVVASALEVTQHSQPGPSPRQTVTHLETLEPVFDQIETVRRLRWLARQYVHACAGTESSFRSAGGGAAGNIAELQALKDEAATLRSRALGETNSMWLKFKETCERVILESRAVSGAQYPSHDVAKPAFGALAPADVMSFDVPDEWDGTTASAAMPVDSRDFFYHGSQHPQILRESSAALVLEVALAQLSSKVAVLNEQLQCSTVSSILAQESTAEHNASAEGLRSPWDVEDSTMDLPLDGTSEQHQQQYTTVDLLEAVESLLDGQPDTVLSHPRWELLVRAMVKAVVEEEQGSSTVLERYFGAASSRQRLATVRVMLSLLDMGSAIQLQSDKVAGTFVRLLLRFVQRLPEDWAALLDAEVGTVLRRFLSCVVVPYAAICSEVDPTALWLRVWVTRPSLACVLADLPFSSATLLQHLVECLPNSHALSVVATLLCFISRGITSRGSAEAWTSLDAYNKAQYQQQHPMFLLLYSRCCRVLSERSSTIAPEVVKLVSGALQANVTALPHQSIKGLYDVVTTLRTEDDSGLTTEAGPPPTWEAWRVRLMGALLLAMSGRLPSDTLRHLDSVVRVQLEEVCTAGSNPLVAEVRALWCALLPMYWQGLPRVMSCVLKASEMETACSSRLIYGPHQLVALSSSLDGWLHLRESIGDTEEEGAASLNIDYDSLLDALLFCPRESTVGDGVAGPIINSDETSPAVVGIALRAAPPSVLSAETMLLLMRWCTCDQARLGLLAATMSSLEARGEHQLRIPLASPLPTLEPTRPPLMVPVEECLRPCDADVAPPSETQRSTEEERRVSYATLLNSTRMLLVVMHCPGAYAWLSPEGERAGASAGLKDATLHSILEQVSMFWLRDEVDERRGGGEGVKDEGSSGSYYHCGHGYGEDSLLLLLCLATVAVLVNPRAEEHMWRAHGAAVMMRQLRLLCESRRGVDPVYFLVRFLTSSKGRKRLLPIVTRGFAADLRVDTVIAVNSFVDGEAGPPAIVVPRSLLSNAEDALMEARHSADTAAESVSLTHAAMHVLYAYYHQQGGSEAAVEALGKQSAVSWINFDDGPTRAVAVARLVEVNSPSTCSILAAAGIDLLFLSTLCVCSWLPALSNSRLTRSSVCELARRGLGGWEELVASSLAAFVEKSVKELAECHEAEVDGWPSSPGGGFTPCLSPLMTQLLIRPFSLLV